MHIYVLTGLTRNAGAQRRVVIQSFDLPARRLAIFAAGFVPAIIVTAIFWTFVRVWALLAIPMVEAGIFWLFEARSRKGLRLRNYQMLRDKRRSATGQFFVCGQPVDFTHGKAVTIVSSSVPGAREVNALAAARVITLAHDTPALGAAAPVKPTPKPAVPARRRSRKATLDGGF